MASPEEMHSEQGGGESYLLLSLSATVWWKQQPPLPKPHFFISEGSNAVRLGVSGCLLA